MDKLKGGLADDMNDSEFDKNELDKGIKVEKEHTKDEKVAKEIAKDHLMEDPNYYTKLSKIHEQKNVLSFDNFVNEMYGRNSSNQGVPDYSGNDIAGIEEEDQNSYVILEKDGQQFVIEENDLDEFTEYASANNKTYNIEEHNAFVEGIINEDGEREDFQRKHRIRFKKGKWIVPNIKPII